MSINRLYGLKKYLINLTKLSDSKKLPQVLMLTGKEGQGKFTLVHHLMAYIFDKDNYDLETLTIIKESIINNNLKENYNPNIIYHNCIGNNIKIDDIRKLKLDLQKSSLNKFNRFIIFDDVENLNENCVNALLKTIEEPSETNFFILVNNQKQTILETLKSRSIEIIVFLNNIEKTSIIKKLLIDFEVDEKIDSNDTALTPGNYLKYNKLIIDEKININDDIIINIQKLLYLYKSKKNIDYFNFTIYLINQHYLTKSKNKLSINDYNKRINIIKKLHESNKLNLNHVNLITEIENYI